MTNYKLNLQLFATGENLNTTTELSAEMKTFYDKTLITLASPYLVHDQFGQKRDIPKNGGKIIEFRKFSFLLKALLLCLSFRLLRITEDLIYNLSYLLLFMSV